MKFFYVLMLSGLVSCSSRDPFDDPFFHEQRARHNADVESMQRRRDAFFSKGTLGHSSPASQGNGPSVSRDVSVSKNDSAESNSNNGAIVGVSIFLGVAIAVCLGIWAFFQCRTKTTSTVVQVSHLPVSMQIL